MFISKRSLNREPDLYDRHRIIGDLTTLGHDLLISPCISAQSCLISAICSARVVANGRLAIDNVIETSPRWPKAMNRTY